MSFQHIDIDPFGQPAASEVIVMSLAVVCGWAPNRPTDGSIMTDYPQTYSASNDSCWQTATMRSRTLSMPQPKNSRPFEACWTMRSCIHTTTPAAAEHAPTVAAQPNTEPGKGKKHTIRTKSVLHCFPWVQLPCRRRAQPPVSSLRRISHLPASPAH